MRPTLRNSHIAALSTAAAALVSSAGALAAGTANLADIAPPAPPEDTAPAQKAVQAIAQNELEKCWLEQLRMAPADTTLEQVRASCRSLEESSADPATAAEMASVPPGSPPEAPPPTPSQSEGAKRRLFGEWASYDNPYTLTLNRPSYFMMGRSFTQPNTEPFTRAIGTDAPAYNNVEAKFQISLKAPLMLNVLDAPVDIMAGYTNRSFWQVFNKEVSSPFRETNHEPEIWARWRTDIPALGGTFRAFNFGLDHQSNGQSGLLSRSWNRTYVEALWERQPVALNMRVWKRWDERADQDDNPDIVDYMGNFELTAIYGVDDHEFSAMVRRNFSTKKGAVQVDWSFPLFKNLRGYVQWFDGYGESLIDYNHRNRSLGFGVQLGGWLL